MTNEITTLGPQFVARALDAEQFIARWKEGRSPETLKAYTADLANFQAWLGRHLDGNFAAPASIAVFLSMHPGQANETARAWRGQMLDEKLAPATINRRLAALRSLVNLAREFGHIVWLLQIKDVRSRRYRDTRGPAPDDIARVLEHVGRQPRATTAARDVAIVMLMFANGLRVGELVGLDLEHFDARGGRVSVMGKGRLEREWLTLAQPTFRAVRHWVSLRGRDEGALFRQIDRHGRILDRLTTTGVWDRMQAWGAELDLVLRPHGLRHSAITAVLDATKGDIRAARHFARHGSADVTLIYDDNREDQAGASSALIANRMGAVIDGLMERNDEAGE